jgi:hypothetical protein
METLEKRKKPSENHTNASSTHAQHTTKALASVWLRVVQARHSA